MKTAELTGAALDWAVAKCEGAWVRDGVDDDCPEYSTDWSQGGAIIEREKISLDFSYRMEWSARLYEPDSEPWVFTGQTPLIAAMRCYVASKLGDDMKIPEELA